MVNTRFEGKTPISAAGPDAGAGMTAGWDIAVVPGPGLSRCGLV